MGKAAKAGTPVLDVEVVPIDSLTLDPRNARKHGRRNLDAMRALRWTEVAITRVPAGWTDDQVRAYALADNRTAELAEWDDAVLADMLAELDAGGWDLNSIGFDGLAEIERREEPPAGQSSPQPAPTASGLGDLERWE